MKYRTRLCWKCKPLKNPFFKFDYRSRQTDEHIKPPPDLSCSSLVSFRRVAAFHNHQPFFFLCSSLCVGRPSWPSWIQTCTPSRQLHGVRSVVLSSDPGDAAAISRCRPWPDSRELGGRIEKNISKYEIWNNSWRNSCSPKKFTKFLLFYHFSSSTT